MAKIKLVDVGWSMIPEGNHVFKIESVLYKASFGKLEINLVNQTGQKHKERYTLITKKKVNEGAQKAFSYFAKTALNNFTLEEIDPDDLVGCYVSATVAHVEQDELNEKTGLPYVNVRLNDLKSAVGFDKKSTKKAAAPVEEDYEDEEDEDEIDIDDFFDEEEDEDNE